MKGLTKFELQLLESAIEMKIVVYECYDQDPKFKKAINDYKNLLTKVKFHQHLLDFQF